jgi:hypothetical protein
MHNGTGRNARIKELQRRVTEKAVERAALTKEWVIDKLRENFRFGCPGSPVVADVEWWTRQMIARTLSRRLDRLEGRLLPPDNEVKGHRIVFVDGDGTVTDGQR